MLQVKNNSVVCPLILGASYSEFNTFQNFLYNNSVNVLFFDSKVRITAISINTFQIPQKCLKSFNSLALWVINKVNKDLSNFK